MIKLDENQIKKHITTNMTLLRDYLKLAFICDLDSKVYYNCMSELAAKLKLSIPQTYRNIKQLNNIGLIENIQNKYIKILYLKKE